MIFFVLKQQNNMHIEVLCYPECHCWKKDKVSFWVEESHLHIGQNQLCQPQIGYTTPRFWSNQHTGNHLAIFINNGGRVWTTKQFGHSHIVISIRCVCRLEMYAAIAKCHCWHTKYYGVTKEQKQNNKNLQEQLAEFNCIQYRMLPANATRGKKVLQALKKVSLTPMNQISQQAIASCVWKSFGRETRCYQRIEVNTRMRK